jgi:hypothetical protein
MEQQLAKTILGTEIPENTRGIVYLCQFNYDNMSIKVVNEILCDTVMKAMNLYASIPNPESQVVVGRTYADVITSLIVLHDNMKRKEWLEDLAECI